MSAVKAISSLTVSPLFLALVMSTTSASFEVLYLTVNNGFPLILALSYSTAPFEVLYFTSSNDAVE